MSDIIFTLMPVKLVPSDKSNACKTCQFAMWQNSNGAVRAHCSKMFTYTYDKNELQDILGEVNLCQGNFTDNNFFDELPKKLVPSDKTNACKTCQHSTWFSANGGVKAHCAKMLTYTYDKNEFIDKDLLGEVNVCHGNPTFAPNNEPQGEKK